MEEDIRVNHLIGERKPNLSLLELDDELETHDLDIGEDATEDDRKYSNDFLCEVRKTFFLTKSAYEKLKKHILKDIYQLSKTITNMDENQDHYCEDIWDIIQEYELFYKECMRNPNLFSIPFVYGIELIFRRCKYEYKLPSGDLTDGELEKFKNILKNIRLFLKFIRGTPGSASIGSGLIFRICISIIENLNVLYATGGEPTDNTTIRYSEVLSTFNIEIILRNRSKKKVLTGFESKNEIKKRKK
jgi:hypothetical protein